MAGIKSMFYVCFTMIGSHSLIKHSYITLFKCAESLAATEATAQATAALRLHCAISTLCISTNGAIRNEIPSNFTSTHENVRAAACAVACAAASLESVLTLYVYTSNIQ